jgi:hypothetical protein
MGLTHISKCSAVLSTRLVIIIFQDLFFISKNVCMNKTIPLIELMSTDVQLNYKKMRNNSPVWGIQRYKNTGQPLASMKETLSHRAWGSYDPCQPSAGPETWHHYYQQTLIITSMVCSVNTHLWTFSVMHMHPLYSFLPTTLQVLPLVIWEPLPGKPWI